MKSNHAAKAPNELIHLWLTNPDRIVDQAFELSLMQQGRKRDMKNFSQKYQIATFNGVPRISEKET